jgi:multicomponent Na+:H+ antiporter subunit F
LGTKTVLMIAVLGFIVGEPDLYIDIALMYALIGFIGTVAVLKVSEFGDLGQAQSPRDGDKS